MKSPLNAMMVLDAIKFINEKHAGQVRRGSGDPYVSHPIAVSYIVAAFKSSRRLVELLVAASCTIAWKTPTPRSKSWHGASHRW